MSTDDQPYPSPFRAWLTVFILMLASVLSFVDRQILSLLVAPIRSDLQISDTQLSLLMGFSFALFYTVCGIPLGRLADTRSRRGLVAAGVLLWSLMTAVCGIARTYTQFLFGRIGVAVGEAALSPAAFSLIADNFAPHRRATAMSVYSMGIYLGSGLAYLLGGLVITLAAEQGDWQLPLVGAVRSWQMVFIVLGVAGIFFTLALLLLHEPARRGGAAVAIPVREVWRYLQHNRRCVLFHNLGFACIAFASYGSAAWIPAFYVRSHGWTAGQAGIVYGSVVMLVGCLGVVAGGRWADRMSRPAAPKANPEALLREGTPVSRPAAPKANPEALLREGTPVSRAPRSDANMRVGLYAALASLPFVIAFPLITDGWVATLVLAPAVFCLAMPFGVASAAIAEIVPNAMRGQASACYLFVVNLIGLGLGPTAIALMTDYVFADDEALRYSLAVAGPVAMGGAALLLWRGLRPYRESREYLQQWLARAG